MPLPYKKTGTEQRLAPTAFKKFMYESTKLKYTLLHAPPLGELSAKLTERVYQQKPHMCDRTPSPSALTGCHLSRRERV